MKRAYVSDLLQRECQAQWFRSPNLHPKPTNRRSTSPHPRSPGPDRPLRHSLRSPSAHLRSATPSASRLPSPLLRFLRLPPSCLRHDTPRLLMRKAKLPFATALFLRCFAYFLWPRSALPTVRLPCGSLRLSFCASPIFFCLRSASLSSLLRKKGFGVGGCGSVRCGVASVVVRLRSGGASVCSGRLRSGYATSRVGQ